MRANGGDVLFEQGLAPGGFFTSGGERNFAGLQIGGEGDFGVHGDVFSTGQVDDHIGLADSGI